MGHPWGLGGQDFTHRVWRSDWLPGVGRMLNSFVYAGGEREAVQASLLNKAGCLLPPCFSGEGMPPVPPAPESLEGPVFAQCRHMNHCPSPSSFLAFLQPGMDWVGGGELLRLRHLGVSKRGWGLRGPCVVTSIPELPCHGADTVSR